MAAIDALMHCVTRRSSTSRCILSYHNALCATYQLLMFVLFCQRNDGKAESAVQSNEFSSNNFPL